MTDTGTVFTCADVPGWVSKGTDSAGVQWTVTQLSGWDEPPDSRASFAARANAGGSFDGPVYDDVRVVTWMGVLQAPTRAARQAAKLTLATLARVFRDGSDLLGRDEDGDRLVHGKRSPGWKIAPFGPLGLQYQAVVVCPDPYKYGPAVSVSSGLPTPGQGGLRAPLGVTTHMLSSGLPGTSGRMTLVNPGTDDAWPTFTITGPVLGGLSLTDVASGRRIVYAGDVPAGANLLIIDSAAGHAELNGADRTGLLTVKQWWPVPPSGLPSSSSGTLNGVTFVDNGDGTVTMSSPDLVDEGTDVLITQAVLATSLVQFATFGASGQAGTCTATVTPTYQ
jgi:hypothetical protein